MSKLYRTRGYLHPVTYAQLAGATVGELGPDTPPAEARKIKADRTRYVNRGIEAALILALEIPGYHVNPNFTP
jgi:hypothetical protein